MLWKMYCAPLSVRQSSFFFSFLLFSFGLMDIETQRESTLSTLHISRVRGCGNSRLSSEKNSSNSLQPITLASVDKSEENLGLVCQDFIFLMFVLVSDTIIIGVLVRGSSCSKAG